MKKLLLTSLLSLGLLLPASISASANSSTSTTEVFAKKAKKSKKSRKGKRSKTRSSRSYSRSRGCTYNGHPLNVGPRGGCYYYSGNSKKYVDKSNCSNCN